MDHLRYIHTNNDFLNELNEATITQKILYWGNWRCSRQFHAAIM